MTPNSGPALPATRSHRSRGVYRLFEWGFFYESFQRGLGGDAARRRLVRDFLRPPHGARILDIGCGTGTILDYLPDEITYVGFDFNPGYIAHARARHGHRGQFFAARVEDAAEMGDGFDMVFATAILHHLDDRAADALIASAHGHLRPGGVLFTCDPVRHVGQSAVARILISLDRGRCVRTAEGYRDLVAGRFAAVESAVLTDLLRIPYSHFVMRACKSGA